MPILNESVENDRTTKVGLLLVLFVSSFYWNWRFGDWYTLPKVLKMNDVGGILLGYRQTPNLVSGGMKWWYGPWIQDGIQAYRPLSSYLLWIESYIGLRWGFFWGAVIGFFLLLILSGLCVALSQRITQCKACAFLTTVLVPAVAPNTFNGTQPEYWLAWYPVHHDLLMITCLIAAILAFDIWLERGEAKYLIWTWACFIAGILAKEFVYIFPAMAVVIVLRQRTSRAISHSLAWRQVGLLFLTVLACYAYRTIVLPAAYNPPPLKRVHFLRKPFFYWFNPYYGYVLSGVEWYAGLAVLLFVVLGGTLRWGRKIVAQCLKWPFGWLLPPGVVGAVIGLYCTATSGSITNAFWYLFDSGYFLLRARDLIAMVFILYMISLIWKYRGQEPGVAAWCLMALSYIPVFTYLGWHYTLAGWFMRCAVFWPIVAKLVLIDLEKPIERFYAMVGQGNKSLVKLR